MRVALFLLLPFLLTLSVQNRSTNLDEIHIWEPASLRSVYSNSSLSYTIANFGTVPYGHSIYGTVFKAFPTDGCSELTNIPWDKNQGTLIVFVERGNCHFAEKVLNAQKIGAGLVIMGDNADEDVSKIMPIEKTAEVLNKITIPSLLIAKKDADNFKNVFNDLTAADKFISFAINFSLIKRNDKADLKMILQVDDFRSYETITSFSPYYTKFKQSIDLKVHYKVFKNLPFLMETQNCLQKEPNFYCVINSNPGKKSTGLLSETLRQICLVDNDFDLFVEYLTVVRKTCFEKDGEVIPDFGECATKVFERVIPSTVQSSINKCTDSNNDHIFTLLENNNEKIKYNLINYSPLIFINGYFYRGNYQDSHHLTEAFCNSFEVPPSGCEKLEAFQQFRDYSSVAIFRFVVMCLLFGSAFVFVTIAVFYFYYRRRMSTQFGVELNHKINEAMSKYYPNEKNEYEGVTREIPN